MVKDDIEKAISYGKSFSDMQWKRNREYQRKLDKEVGVLWKKETEMTKQKVYVLWDEVDGYKVSQIYVNLKSAQTALQIKYTEYWINNKKAKIEEIDLVDLFA